MTTHVSKDVENTINAALRSGQSASANEMVDKLVREYDQRKRRQTKRAKPVKARTENEILQQMLADGLITRLPDRRADIDDEDDEPVVISGEPLSETIIRERR
jgi:hypothetical protein